MEFIKRHPIIFKALVPGIVGVLLSLALAVGGTLWVSGWPPPFLLHWDQVVPGMSRTRVEELLGSSDREMNSFHLGQRKSYEDRYDQAEASGSTYYLSWDAGIDRVFTIGFDGNDMVTLKAYGDT